MQYIIKRLLLASPYKDMIAICQSYNCTVTGPCHHVEVSNHDMVYPFFSGGSHRFMLLTCTYVIKTTY